MTDNNTAGADAAPIARPLGDIPWIALTIDEALDWPISWLDSSGDVQSGPMRDCPSTELRIIADEFRQIIEATRDLWIWQSAEIVLASREDAR